jgi:UDP-N-acetylglucosamine 4,6-dehydratase/5-epimerase
MKRYAITGGTGTLGTALLEKMLRSGIAEDQIIIFSRDENKQKKMASQYPEVTFVLGDVSHRESCRDLVSHHKIHTIFHCAALKHVDKGEDNVSALKRVNIDGTSFMLDEAIKSGVEHFVMFSTDKAVLPINAYGLSKGFAEKYIQYRMKSNRPSINASIYRWGNIIGSRGSVIEKWVDLINICNDIHLTDARMTRFWLTIEEAVDYVWETYQKVDFEPRICPTIKAYPLVGVITCLEEIIGKKSNCIVTGIRAGEKIHECLLSTHDYCITSNSSPQYTHDELVEKLRPVVYKILADKQ